MQHETSKAKALIQDWRWIVGVSLLLAIPTYGFTAPMRYAVAAHILATLVYLGLLLLFGPGFVIEGAVCVMILATLFAMCSRPLHRFIHRKNTSMTMTWPNQALERTAPRVTPAAPPPSPAQPSRRAGQSLSLRSLAVATRIL